ncbi:actin-like ATPase domain-containing protein [Rhizophagus irregularis]|uniref:Actin-like ATPase domain-containing protein n=1 Tax=Rhizophagus irregularis TaxID=588596 RepID=A0A2N0P7V2_9GLOM|nr:actin-like ATPase domain-containing protein [Rhizophagus irregularis]
MSSSDDIRVVVGVDFGTTYSGFAYAHKSNPNDVQVYDFWKGLHGGWFKTPTVINYDDSCANVMSWGLSALATKPRGRSLRPSSKPIELFKLHLLKRGTTSLPDALNYKDVIKDYLKELGNYIRRRVKSHWYSLDFDSQVIIVITVPAEFDDNAIETMSECAIGANLVKEENIERNLKFTTEPEAAAINSISSLRNEYLLKSGDLFMVVDCGGGTVDLTTRELLDEDKLSEITVRAGDNCGSCYVDQAFIEFLDSKIGSSAIDILKENHYVNLQYIVQDFCTTTKIFFTGREDDFLAYYLNLDEYEPIKKCITGEEKEKLEADEWLIEAKFDDVKEMFDPVIERIFTLIRGQLEQLKRLKRDISLMLLVGGFSESEYLQDRIRGEFSSEVPNISVPKNPVTSVMKGAVKFGLSEEVVESRVLNWTYGTCVVRKWLPTDPLSYKLPNGYVKVFEKFGEEGYGAPIKLNSKVIKDFKSFSLTQRKINIDMYVTKSLDAKYIGDPEIKLLRKFQLELPELDSYEDIEDITISFILKFGRVGMSAIAENKNTGHECKVTFKYDFDLV